MKKIVQKIDRKIFQNFQNFEKSQNFGIKKKCFSRKSDDFSIKISIFFSTFLMIFFDQKIMYFRSSFVFRRDFFDRFFSNNWCKDKLVYNCSDGRKRARHNTGHIIYTGDHILILGGLHQLFAETGVW